MTFEDLGLSPEVLRAVQEVGYTTPTPIQEQAIPVVLMGRDVLGCAQTGTGKTAGFTLPMIDILSSGRARARMPRSLILAPTRELAAQVAENFELYGKYGKLSMALLIGGSSFVEQVKKLDRGVDVLIATPGRLIDLFERGKILLADVKILVIDEADRMLDMGFIPDVERIVGLLPDAPDAVLLGHHAAGDPPPRRRLPDKPQGDLRRSAGLGRADGDPGPGEAARRRQGKARRPAQPDPQRRGEVGAGVLQPQARRRRGVPFAQAARLSAPRCCTATCRSRRTASRWPRSLERHGFSVAALHGDMAQPVRMETLQGFKDAKVEILVCSDVAARGLDIPAVSHVFNFDVPSNPEDYVHRIGRTGRAGRSGKAFTLALPEEGKYLANVVSMLGMPIPEVKLAEAETWSAEEAEASGRGRRRGGRESERGSGRGERRGGRGGRGERREARPDRGPRPQAAEAPAEEAVEAAGEDSVDAAIETQEVVPFERQREEETKKPAAARDSRDDRRPRDRSRSRDRDNDDDDGPAPGETAFGDHVPAFMLRPAKVA
jgi:superfamily II DNA/RNA helicase